MFKAKSTTKEAKKLIAEEIVTYYDYESKGLENALKNMKLDAESANAGWPKHTKYQLSNYTKGAYLVDGGCFRCYYSHQIEFLKQIYGEGVKDWSGDKLHNTYKHLIGREYEALLKKHKMQ